jgi:hypothetical protein
MSVNKPHTMEPDVNHQIVFWCEGHNNVLMGDEPKLELIPESPEYRINLEEMECAYAEAYMDYDNCHVVAVIDASWVATPGDLKDWRGTYDYTVGSPT